MPLTRILNLDHGVRLALWRMTEEPSGLPVPQGCDFSDIHSASRLREKLVVYAMLRVLTGRSDLLVRHLPSGRPFVDGLSLSISHTRGWAALLLSEKPVALGVDIEYVSERVNKVADRFIRPDEQSESLAHRLINWSAKETVYKLLSQEDLQYFEMRLGPFAPGKAGSVAVEDLRLGRTVDVSYELNDDYVLTWAVKTKC